MSAKLLAYEYVPPGFEMAIVKKDVKPWEEGFRELKAWNLWWNDRPFDPETWDKEIRLINEMQSRLGALTSDQRLIRAHMIEFCRQHPIFPQSIDILCEEIGTSRFSKPVKIGCFDDHPRSGLLETLGYRDPQSLNDQRKETLKKYVRSLQKWLVKGRPENHTESKIFHFLGQPTNTNKAFVEKLISVIDSEVPAISSLKKLCEDEYRETHGKSILSDFATVNRYRPLACFTCKEGCPDGASILSCDCPCGCLLLIDAGLLCTRTPIDKSSIYDEFSRYGDEHILAYAFAINSWLKEAPSKPVTSLISPRYITKDNALEISERVHSSLGEKDEAKAWLAACLLKTIKDNQRIGKRAFLIDSFPEATSWFIEKHGRNNLIKSESKLRREPNRGAS